MELIESVYLAIGGSVLGAALSFAVQRTMARITATNSAKAAETAGMAESIANLRKAITALELDNAILKKDVLPLSLAVQQWAVAKLTHNHTPEMDGLLLRIGKLNEVDEARLSELLKERVIEFNDPEIDAVERIAASMLLDIVAWVKETESVVSPDPDTMQLVTTPPTKEEEPPKSESEPDQKSD